MIEEQAGIQVVGEVDQQLHPAFADLHELALGGLPLVLLGAALTLTALDHHLVLVDAQRLRKRGYGVKHTSLGFLGIN
ncbi:hypothetical protein D3C86_1856450 [compost metagenome]